MAAITISVPLLVLGNAVALLLSPWTGDLLYALPGFPDDPLELKGEDRARLAEDGIRSVWPFGPGIELLRDARLPDGEPAFTEFEISHMEDVRVLVRIGFALWLTAATAALVSMLALCRRGLSGIALTAVRRGAILTLLLLGIAGLSMLVAYEAVFDGFHALFFADGTWSFADRYTLRRIYPDEFWGIASAAVVLLAVLQLSALILATRQARGSAVSSGPATP